MNCDHVLRTAGLLVPDPLFATTIATARALTLTDGSSSALCTACVGEIPADSTDLAPRGTAPGSPGPATPQRPEATPAMPTPPARRASDPWRDADGTPIPVLSQKRMVNSLVPGPPMISAQTAAQALCELFLTNADRGDNAANDHLITEIIDRIRTRDADNTPTHEAAFPPFPPAPGGPQDADTDHE